MSTPKKFLSTVLFCFLWIILLAMILNIIRISVKSWKTSDEMEAERRKMVKNNLEYNNTKLQKNLSQAYSIIETNENINLLLTIEGITNKYGLDYHLVLAVIMQESRFDPHAVSEANAKGLMQVRDSVHSWVDSDKIFEPTYNVNVGCEILKNYIEQEGSVKKGLRAYFGKCDKGWRYAQEVLLIKQTLDKQELK